MTNQLVHLEEVAKFINGRAFKPSEWSGSGLPIIRIQNLTGTNYAFNYFDGVIDEPVRVRRGDILISWSASLGVYRWQGNDAVLNQHIFKVRLNKGVNPDYFFYAATNAVQEMVSRVHGSTMQHITKDRFDSIQIRLPDLSEQRRIAGQLEQVDRLRRTRRYALELTDTLLPAAFLKLFGDPGESTQTYDRVQVEDLFSDSRGGAKCGPFGSALKKHEYVTEGIPVWTMNNVGANEFLEDGCLYITPEKFEELAAYDAQNGDILISRAGTVGRMAIVRTKHPQSIIHSNIIRLSLNHKKILPIYFVVLMTWFAPRIARLKRGQEDAYTFISTGSLGELQIPLPPFSLQEKFANLVEELERLRAVQREALRQAEHLFQTLLHQAFSESA